MVDLDVDLVFGLRGVVVGIVGRPDLLSVKHRGVNVGALLENEKSVEKRGRLQTVNLSQAVLNISQRSVLVNLRVSG